MPSQVDAKLRCIVTLWLPRMTRDSACRWRRSDWHQAGFSQKKLLEVAGPVGAREILLLGDPLPASKMHALGMISRITPTADLENSVDAIVQRLVQNAPLSLRAMKALLLREMTFRDGIEHADVDSLVALASGSEDAKEGMRARLEKRAPKFTGS